ncbi:MAG: hypothetical protein KKF41_10400 [Actinobacteria bacterium]|nr:hypothetical protein [Actinomycetota bacterium]MBU1943069.1 hypothetical protein [Actinomycetota bacterium]MBU2687984.1 hypothetical protein [Actinomycetota bacterium]
MRVAFIYGAVLDALALAPMLSRRVERIMWGIGDTDERYSYAMGYGAPLMAGWTGLLAWAARKPLERRFVAPLTLQVVVGLVLVEIYAMRKGVIRAGRLAPTLALQAFTAWLFARAWLAASGNTVEE